VAGSCLSPCFFGFAFLYLPILSLIVFSFNDSRLGDSLGRVFNALVWRVAAERSPDPERRMDQSASGPDQRHTGHDHRHAWRFCSDAVYQQIRRAAAADRP
jgi:hypothetical protein